MKPVCIFHLWASKLYRTRKSTTSLAAQYGSSSTGLCSSAECTAERRAELGCWEERRCSPEEGERKNQACQSSPSSSLASGIYTAWTVLLFLSLSIVVDLMLYSRWTLNCHSDKSYKLVPTADRSLIYYGLSIKWERKNMNFGVKQSVSFGCVSYTLGQFS